jgi:hypothetical protein
LDTEIFPHDHYVFYGECPTANCRVVHRDFVPEFRAELRADEPSLGSFQFLSQSFTGKKAFVDEKRSDHISVNMESAGGPLNLVISRTAQVHVIAQVFKWAQQALSERSLELLSVGLAVADHPQLYVT